jgi:hypothetical protein
VCFWSTLALTKVSKYRSPPGLGYVQIRRKAKTFHRRRLSDSSVIPILWYSDPLQPRLGKEPRMESPSTKLLVTKFTTVICMTESLVWVQCSAPGLRFLQSQAKSHGTLGISMANGIADTLLLQAFPIKVLNTSKCDRVIPKGMVLGHALPHPKAIIALTSEEPPPVTEFPDVYGEFWK